LAQNFYPVVKQCVRRRFPIWKKILISFIIFILIAGVAFQVYITRYLSPMVRSRLEDIIVKGSDSLYQFQVRDFDVGFWGGSITFKDLHIYTDSNRYRQMLAEKKLPALTMDLNINRGYVEGIHLRNLIFKKEVDIKEITINKADVKLVRHFRGVEDHYEKGEPLWKLIQPKMKSIAVKAIVFREVDVNYHNIDSSTAFNWQFNKSTVIFNDLLIDSLSAQDSTRILFSKNAGFLAKDIKVNTTDGLYQLAADEMKYSSSECVAEFKQFSFLPRISDAGFNKHFGYQHERYKVNVPGIQLRNFSLPRWISNNELIADTMELASPNLDIYLDRNAKPNPYSKLGQYPHQLLQRASFGVRIKHINTTNAKMTYHEKNDKNGMTGTVVFPAINGHIENVTNNPQDIAKNNICIARVRSMAQSRGRLNAVFRFNLADRSGAYSLNATIENLDAAQLHDLALAMTSAEMQTFRMKRLDYSLSANERSGTAHLKMQYSDMDVLLSKVDENGNLDKKGLLSFFVNHMVIYNENPKNGEERTADNVTVSRDITRSFFNHIWKTLYTSAGKIVIRPAAARKIAKRKARHVQGHP